MSSTGGRGAWCGAVALLALAGPAAGGGIAIGTQSGSGTGNAFAGGAAAAEDASTVWYNPAGMVLLPRGRHVAVSAHLLKPSFKFSDTGSTGVFARPGASDGGDGGDWAAVPQTYFAMDLGPRLSFGLALNVPFGLTTDYEAGWRGELTALKSEAKSLNVNPAISYRVNDTVAIGAGLSFQYAKTKLSSAAGPLGVATLKLDDHSFGWNAGALFQVTPDTRLGIHYRSAIAHELSGTVTYSNLPAGNGNAVADLKLPDSLSLSVFSAVGPRWELMADLTWTGWSDFQQLAPVRTSPSALGPVGSSVSVLPFRWRDTWRVSLGANYKYDERTKLRFGIAHDPTPTKDQFRTPRLPDQDRLWLAFGVQLKPSKANTIELGYAHEFIRDATVNNSVTGAPGALVGRFKSRVDIFSLHFSHMF